MKNAYVLEDHHGDDGTVRAGAILRDLSDQRFETLKKRGLVREATAAELGNKAGSTKKAAEPENKKAAEPSNKSGSGKA